MGNRIFQSNPQYLAARMGISEPERDPMAFTNCPKERFLEYFPSGDTSLMIGIPCHLEQCGPGTQKQQSSQNQDKDS